MQNNLQNQARAAVYGFPCNTELKREAVQNVLLLIDHGAGILPFSLPRVIERLHAYRENQILVAECWLEDPTADAEQKIAGASHCLKTAHVYGFLADKLSALLPTPETAPEA